MDSWHETTWCQGVRTHIVSVLLVMGAVVAISAFFIVPKAVAAEESCGYKIYKEGLFYEPRDCDNPFSHDHDFPYNATTTLAGQVITEGGTITVPRLGEEVELKLEISDEEFNAIVALYKHIPEGYRYIDSTSYIHDRLTSITATGTYSAVISVGEGVVSDLGYRHVTELSIEVGEEPIDLSEPSSVLFLPGIQASRLYERDTFSDEKRWEPFGDSDAERLSMSADGESNNDIYTKDVVDEVFFGRYQFYIDFLGHLADMEADGDISDWETFPYDWRYSVLDIVENGTQYKDERRYPTEVVEELATENSSPVTLITHSNGGLLAKALVRELAAQDKAHLVDRILFIGTPHTGTPKTIGGILHGFEQELGFGYVLSDGTAREVIQNLPGGYGLVPSAEYLSQTNNSLVTFADEPELSAYRDTYGNAVSSVSELHDFLTGAGTDREEAEHIEEPIRANASMLTDAFAAHDDILDDWTAPEHIAVTEIVGVGLDTVNGFQYDTFKREECTAGFFFCEVVTYTKPVPQFTQFGDGTVVATSALAYAGDSETFYVDLKGIEDDKNLSNVEHADITESAILQELVSLKLGSSSIEHLDYVHRDTQPLDVEKDIISVHSPVSVALESTAGARVERRGSGTETEIITEIPGSRYLEFAGGKYVIVPSDTDYTVELNGTATSSYTLRIDTLRSSGKQINLHTLSAATTTPDMYAEFTKTEGAFSSISIDYNGDGEPDSKTTLDGKMIEEEPDYTLADLTRIVKEANIRPAVLERMLLFRIERAEDTMGQENNGSFRFRSVARQLQGMAHQVERMEGRGRIDTASAEELLEVIDFLKLSYEKFI